MKRLFRSMIVIGLIMIVISQIAIYRAKHPEVKVGQIWEYISSDPFAQNLNATYEVLSVSNGYVQWVNSRGLVSSESIDWFVTCDKLKQDVEKKP